MENFCDVLKGAGNELRKCTNVHHSFLKAIIENDIAALIAFGKDAIIFELTDFDITSINSALRKCGTLSDSALNKILTATLTHLDHIAYDGHYNKFLTSYNQIATLFGNTAVVYYFMNNFKYYDEHDVLVAIDHRRFDIVDIMYRANRTQEYKFFPAGKASIHPIKYYLDSLNEQFREGFVPSTVAEYHRPSVIMDDLIFLLSISGVDLNGGEYANHILKAGYNNEPVIGPFLRRCRLMLDEMIETLAVRRWFSSFISLDYMLEFEDIRHTSALICELIRHERVNMNGRATATFIRDRYTPRALPNGARIQTFGTVFVDSYNALRVRDIPQCRAQLYADVIQTMRETNFNFILTNVGRVGGVRAIYKFYGFCGEELNREDVRALSRQELVLNSFDIDYIALVRGRRELQNKNPYLSTIRKSGPGLGRKVRRTPASLFSQTLLRIKLSMPHNKGKHFRQAQKLNLPQIVTDCLVKGQEPFSFKEAFPSFDFFIS